MLSIVNEELVICDVIDEHEIYWDTMVTYEQAITLPIRILIKKYVSWIICMELQHRGWIG
jgi:hypothetical protein